MAASQKTSKKRAAPSQAGPKAKKVHVEDKPDKKRSRPITQPLATEDAASDSDGPSDDVDDVVSEAEEDVADAGEDAMEVESKHDQRPKDPNGVFHVLCTTRCRTKH